MTSYLKYKKTLFYLLLLTVCSQAAQGSAQRPNRVPPPPAKGASKPAAKPQMINQETQSDESGIIKNSKTLIDEQEKELKALKDNEQIKVDPCKKSYDAWTQTMKDAIEKTETWEATLETLQQAQENRNDPAFGPVVTEEVQTTPVRKIQSAPTLPTPKK